MDKTIKYVAELAHVREVSLLGTAELAYWNDRLAVEELIPAACDGRARILIVAAASRFKGIRYRELSFSILVAPQGKDAVQDCAYLVSAYNSCRLFAFSERVLFKTPYVYGDVRIPALFPPAIQLVNGDDIVFRAEMGNGDSPAPIEPAAIAETGWAGAIFLPRKRCGSDGNVFFARLQGHTQTYPFLGARDLLTLKPERGGEILRDLVDSEFAGHQWIVREDATHARSKTYARSESIAPTCHADLS